MILKKKIQKFMIPAFHDYLLFGTKNHEMLIHGQKSYFLGLTIFKIPQSNCTLYIDTLHGVLKCVQSLSRFEFKVVHSNKRTLSKRFYSKKYVNLEYNTLVLSADKTNESSTKHLMSQVFFLIDLGHSKPFIFIL